MAESLNRCAELVKAAGFGPIPGRTLNESAQVLCLSAAYHKSAAEGLTPEVVLAMRKSRWPALVKSVSGGFQHIISVDNGGTYAEAWAKGDNWYAVTGAGIHGISGVKKGMAAGDAVPLFLKAVFDAPVRRCCGR